MNFKLISHINPMLFYRASYFRLSTLLYFYIAANEYTPWRVP
jgi:hypothetical protein